MGIAWSEITMPDVTGEPSAGFIAADSCVACRRTRNPSISRREPKALDQGSGLWTFCLDRKTWTTPQLQARAEGSYEIRVRVWPAEMEERRAARRYKLILPIEIRLVLDIREFQPIFGRTRDISLRGFYFRIGQRLSLETKLRFSIIPPGEVGTHVFISGRASIARVEEASESSVDHVGIGALIETYNFGQTNGRRWN